MKAENYSRAAILSLGEGVSIEEILSSIRKVLENQGRAKLYPRILKSMLRDIARFEKDTEATVRLKTTGNREKYQKAIEESLKKIGANSGERVIEDETIIGGYSVSIGGKMIDNTHKTKLVNLYRAIIK